MIDIHTHALPNMDDGAANIEESIKMLEDSILQGITICVLTPHCVVHHPRAIDEFIAYRNNQFEQLERVKPSVDLKLLCGAEVYMDHDISQHADISKLCIDNGNYMLIEFPPFSFNPLYDEWIYSLILKGIKPIIAHVDRYNFWKELMQGLSGLKVIYQINASRFLSIREHGHLKKIISQNKKLIVASDMHNIGNRKNNMGTALNKAKKNFPNDYTHMFWNNFDFHADN